MAACLRSLISAADVEKALRAGSSAKVTDALMHVVTGAFEKAPLGSYNGCVYAWNGTVYAPMEKYAFNRLVNDVLKMCGLPDGCWGRVGYVRNMCVDVVMSRELRPDPAVVVFSNCAYDVAGDIAMPLGPDVHAVTKVSYAYDPMAVCMRWKAFLNDVLPDRTLQKILQEFLGAVFIDRRRACIEKMLVLLGSGANGKSVIYKTVKALLGEENVSNFGMASLIGGGDLKRNISTLNGKRLNYCSEIGAAEFRRDSDTLKKLISGEPIEARDVFKSNFTARDIPLMMANANQMPPMKKDETEAVSRRFIIIPFTVTIPPDSQQPTLADDLRDELPGIFNWVMDGRRRFISNNYKISGSKSAEDSLSEYTADSSTVMEFMMRNNYARRWPVTSREPVWVIASALYREYVTWCRTHGKEEAEIEKQNNFGRILNGAGYRRKKMEDAWVWGICGERVSWESTYDKAHGVKRMQNVDMRPFYDNHGIKCVRTRAGIAAALNMSEGIIMKAAARGALEGCSVMVGNTKVYYIDKTKEALRKFLPEEQARDLMRKEDEEVRRKRSKFNHRMHDLGLPYRKYSDIIIQQGRVPQGMIVVPLEWEYEDNIPEHRYPDTLKRRRRVKTKYLNLEELGKNEKTEENESNDGDD